MFKTYTFELLDETLAGEEACLISEIDFFVEYEVRDDAGNPNVYVTGLIPKLAATSNEPVEGPDILLSEEPTIRQLAAMVKTKVEADKDWLEAAWERSL